MKDLAIVTGIVLTVVYFSLSLCMAIGGFSDSRTYSNPCQEPITRGSYIFPAYQLGCWLGQVP